MFKNKKRVLALIMAALLAASAVGSSIAFIPSNAGIVAEAEEAGEAQQPSVDATPFEYETVGNTVTIKKYTGEETTVTVPNIIDGKTVTAIAAGAFKDNTTMRTIVLPDTITSIGDNAFYGCAILANVYYHGDKTAWGTIKIGEGNNVLNASSTSKEYSYHPFLTAWDYDSTNHWHSCLYCDQKKDSAAHSWNNGTKTEDHYKFICSTCGHEMTVSAKCGENLTWTLENGILKITGTGYMYDYTSPKAEDPKVAPWYIVRDQIQSIVLPSEDLKSIGNYAFYGCTNKNLTSIIIPNGVTTVGDYAIDLGENLKSATIGKDVAKFGNNAFAGCNNLYTISYNGTIDDWVQIVFDNAYSNPLFYYGNLNIGNETVTSISISKASTISNYAFYHYEKLKSVILYDNVTSIGEQAFLGATALTEITFGNKIAAIGKGAFDGCTKLSKFYYHGAQEEWNTLKNNNIKEKNTYLINALDTSKLPYHPSNCEYSSISDTQHRSNCTFCKIDLDENHTWDAGTITLEPTEIKEGEMTYTCTACKKTKKEPIPIPGKVELDDKNFPDENFRNIVAEFRTDKSRTFLTQNEVKNVTKMDLSKDTIENTISNLKGIEFFTELEELNVNGQVDNTDLNLSSNTKLKKLLAQGNSATSINLYVDNLEYIDISKSTKLSSFSVQNAKKLTTLLCNDSLNLKKVTLTNATELKQLNCANTPVSLNVSTNVHLKDVISKYEWRDYDEAKNNYIYENTDKNIYVIYKKDKTLQAFNVQFVIVHGTTPSTQTVEKGGKAKRPTPDPEATGYRFLNWYTDNTYKTLYDFENTPITSDVSIYACWETIPKGSVLINADNFPDEAFRAYVSKFDINKKGYLTPEQIADINNIVIDDETYTVKDLTGIKYFTALETLNIGDQEISSVDLSKNTKLIKLYAGDCQLTSLDLSKNEKLKVLEVQNNQLETLDLSKNPELTELRVDGNSLTKLDISNNPQLVNVRAFNNKIVTLDIQENSELIDLVEKNKKKSETIEEKDIWKYADTEDPEKATSLLEYDQSTKLVVYTAKFEMNEHGGTIESQGLDKDATVTKPEDPTSEGFVFLGWFKDEELTTEWNFETDRVNSNVTIYAKWSATRKVNVNVSENGKIKINGQEYATGQYTFESCYEDKLDIEFFPDENAKITKFFFYRDSLSKIKDNKYTGYIFEDADISVEFEPIKEFDVTFDTQGLGVTPDAQKIKEGELVVKPEDPSEDGYIFRGWYKEAECKNAWNFDKDTVNATTVLYAKWEKISTFTLTFNTNGGSAIAPVTARIGTVINLSNYKPTKSGYSIAGWYTDKELTKQVTSIKMTADTTVYAKWAPLPMDRVIVNQALNSEYGIKFTWNKSKNADGYKIYRSTTAGQWEVIAVIANGNTTSYIDKKVVNGTRYTYAVRAYNGSGLSTYTTRSMLRLVAPQLTKYYNNAAGSIYASWNQNSKASGYVVAYTTGGTTKYVKTYGTASITTTIRNLTKGKTYTIKVRAYRTYGGADYYSEWSQPKNVKITK